MNLQASITWIDARNQLPDEDETVLIAESDGEVSSGFLDEGGWRYTSADRVIAEVTHWADMPAAPKN